jgi:hypothetical protein
MSPALVWWMFFNVMARGWSIPAPKPDVSERTKNIQ